MTEKNNQLTSNDLSWRNSPLGETPISTRFDDPYYSLDNGLAETHYVFIEGNRLMERFDALPKGAIFHIAELGFGTGLNALAVMVLWASHPIHTDAHLQFTSFEAFPMTAEHATKALTPFRKDLPVAQLLTHWDTLLTQSVNLPHNISLNLIIGDARKTLKKWEHKADAWFLDGFSPAKNPELWEPELITEVGNHTQTGGTAATYTAAGHVRASLKAAGFETNRIKGFGRKRHMTTAIYGWV